MPQMLWLCHVTSNGSLLVFIMIGGVCTLGTLSMLCMCVHIVCVRMVCVRMMFVSARCVCLYGLRVSMVHSKGM